MKKILIITGLLFSLTITAQENLTTKQKNDAKNALFDSYNVIVDIEQSGTTDTIQLKNKERNIQHINLMLQKEWLNEMLTEEEKTRLKNLQ